MDLAALPVRPTRHEPWRAFGGRIDGGAADSADRHRYGDGEYGLSTAPPTGSLFLSGLGGHTTTVQGRHVCRL